MKKFLVVMLAALTLGVAINTVLPDLTMAGVDSAIASAITAQPPAATPHRVQAHRGITIQDFPQKFRLIPMRVED